MNTKDYDKLTVVSLRDELKVRNLATDGRKAELVERLKSADKAAEEEILDTSVDSGALNGTNAEDLLNEDDVLGVTPAQTENTNEDIEVDAKIQKSQGAEVNKKIVEIQKKDVADLISQDAKLARAQRFGLPVGTGKDTAKDKDAKAKRAERFGIPTPVTLEDAKAKRAARFGLPVTAAGIPKSTAATATMVNEETKTKLLKRAERFGLPVNKDGKTIASSGYGVEKVIVDLDKLKARADRFGSSNATVEEQLKKKARLERFGLTN